MRIMLDTNILISAIIFESKIMTSLIDLLSKKHKILIASYTIKEFNEVIDKKFPGKKKYAKRVLHRMNYELVYSPNDIEGKLFEIRDEDDYIFLYTAVLGNADIFITGDKDFEDVKINKPKIMTASGFLRIYG